MTLAACGGGSSKTLQFATVIDFTGNASNVAPYAISGTLSAEYTINAAGGILGKKVANVTVDTKSDPADGLISLRKAIATDNLVAEFGPGTDTAPALVPVLEKAKILMEANVGQSLYDHQTSPYFWRTEPPDPAAGIAMVEAARRLGYTRVATVFGTDTSAQGDLPGVLAGVKAVGSTLVTNVGLNPDQSSYRSQVQALIAAKPQAILTESDGTTAATFFSELKQQGSLVPIFATNATLQAQYLNPLKSAIGASAVSKDYWVEASQPPAKSPASRAGVTEFNTAIRHVASKLPPPATQWMNPDPFPDGTFPEGNYGGFIAFALAMTAAHSTDPTVVSNYITKVTAPGPGKEVVYTYASGVTALKAGKKIQYIGPAGPMLFDQWHTSFSNQIMEQVNPSSEVPTRTIVINAKTIESILPS